MVCVRWGKKRDGLGVGCEILLNIVKYCKIWSTAFTTGVSGKVQPGQHNNQPIWQVSGELMMILNKKIWRQLSLQGGLGWAGKVNSPGLGPNQPTHIFQDEVRESWGGRPYFPKYFSPFLKIQVLVAPEENFIILVLQQPELAWTMIVHKYICHHGRESLFLNESLSVMIVKQIYGKSILCAPLGTKGRIQKPESRNFSARGVPPPRFTDEKT